jgi:hypothetical protein
MTSNNGLSLTNARDVKANNIFLNYDNDIKNIIELFAFKSDINNITGLPPSTLNSIEKVATALNNNPDFFNYVNQQLTLKRNISDSFDKNYINTLISGYYSKIQIDNNLLLKQDLLTVLSLPGQISLLNQNLIKPLQAGSNITITDLTTRIVIESTSYNKTEVDNALLLKSDKSTTYTKTQVDTMFNNIIDSAPTVLNTLNELAAALNDDANYASTVQNQISLKE